MPPPMTLFISGISKVSIGISGSAMAAVALSDTTLRIGVVWVSAVRFLFMTCVASCWLDSWPLLLPPPERKSTLGSVTSSSTRKYAPTRRHTWMIRLMRKDPPPTLAQYRLMTPGCFGGASGADGVTPGECCEGVGFKSAIRERCLWIE
ncbi:hypothetical protein G5S37_09255 [Roseimicrobium sp. ORNL1]|nr:hypothetical protein G5S37_09255 [Roseimicrobium sp. ORNL1]